MKKITAFLLLISLILPTVPILAETKEIWEPTIAVSDFTYSKDTLTGGVMTVSCTVRKLDTSDNIPIPYSFVTVVKKNGKIFDIKKYDAYSDPLVLVNDKKGYPSVSVTIPDDIKGVTVESYFLDSVKSGKILAPKATFLSNECGIEAIYVDGKRVESFKAENSETELILPASYAHTPDIQVVAKNSSSKVTVSKVTSLSAKEKTTVGIVVKAGGTTVRHKLYLSLKPGSVTEPKMLKTVGEDTQYVNLKTDIMRVPDYGFKEDGVTPITPSDEGFSYDVNLPVDKTLIYTDRDNFYYTGIPYDLLGATAIQISRQIINNDALYLNKDNNLKELGSFVLDCSADVYLFGGGSMDWAKKEGYERVTSADVKIASGSASLAAFSAYRKRVHVKEGETQKVIFGNVTNSAGTTTKNMAFAVKFLEPDSIIEIDEVKVDGVSDFEFDPDVTEYTIELDEGTTVPPEISYKVSGFGATVTKTEATSVPGTTEIKLKSGNGILDKTYKFNFKVFETALTDLKVGDSTIEGFDKNTYDYTYKLPFRWKLEDGIPAVTALGSQYVNIVTVQATKDTMKATITVSADKGATKIYTVTFEETLTMPSSLYTNNSFRYGGIIKAFRFVPTNTDDVVSSFAVSTVLTANGNTNDTIHNNNSGFVVTPSVMLIQFDLATLVDVDLTKPVKLFAYSKQSADVAEWNLTLYDATGTDLSTIDEASELRDLPTWKAKPEILTQKVNKTDNGTYIDITEFVKKCLEENITEPVIAFYVSPIGGTGRQRVYFKFDSTNGPRSRIEYYKYDL